MIDIETLGLSPGSVIFQIAAVPFGPGGVGAGLNAVVSVQASLAAGLTTDPSTVDYWASKPDESSRIFRTAHSAVALYPAEALTGLGMWTDQVASEAGKKRPDLRVWGNGAAFDNALITEACKRVGVRPLWNYRSDRCFRTLKAIRQAVKAPEFEGRPHDALDDARHQARHAVAILTELGWPEDGESETRTDGRST